MLALLQQSSRSGQRRGERQAEGLAASLESAASMATTSSAPPRSPIAFERHPSDQVAFASRSFSRSSACSTCGQGESSAAAAGLARPAWPFRFGEPSGGVCSWRGSRRTSSCTRDTATDRSVDLAVATLAGPGGLAYGPTAAILKSELPVSASVCGRSPERGLTATGAWFVPWRTPMPAGVAGGLLAGRTRRRSCDSQDPPHLAVALDVTVEEAALSQFADALVCLVERAADLASDHI